MTRVLLFLAFTAVGTGLLLHFAGGIQGPQREQPKPVVEERDPSNHPQGPGMTIDGRTFSEMRGLSQSAPPERFVWKDPLSDETIEVPAFIPWRFNAASLKGTQPADADKQGVLCTDVVMRLYRAPETRAETMALLRTTVEEQDAAYEALLHQTFRADEAWVFGRLGEALNRKKTRRARSGMGDTKLILSSNISIVDASQGLDIVGTSQTEVDVWPEQGRAEGRGPFTMTHRAFQLDGEGLSMEHQKEERWGRLTVLRNPVLRIRSDVHDQSGKPVFDFGKGDFRPTHIVSEGRAILERAVGRRETTIRITFMDRVRAEQPGGRSLDAGRVELVASRATSPGVEDKSWNLESFRASERVAVEYPGRTKDGRVFLASLKADRLIHEVPMAGRPTTELEGDVVIVMRGEIPLIGPNGQLRASCRDRASIGPLPAGKPTAGLDAALLELMTLAGDARIVRNDVEPDGRTSEDIIEGDQIEMVVLPKEKGPGSSEGSSSMTAIHFAALGNVRLGGTRIRGTTHRLVGDKLHSERPHVFAEGAGTRFSFPDIGREQRLLGPARPTGDAADAADAPGPGPADGEAEPKGRWVLHRLLATGMVDIDTSLGGPAVGIPAQVTGDEVSYSRVSQRAQVRGHDGQTARIEWNSAQDKTNHIETRTLTLDQAQGRVTADGGLVAQFWVARGGGSAFELPRAAPRTDDEPAGPATLSVRTDARIDLDLYRAKDGSSAKPGAEQLIRIKGPLTAELRNEARAVDRMRARDLELSLVYATEDAAASQGSTAPTARASGSRGTRRTRPATAPRDLERIELEAGSARLDLAGDEARYIEATENVEMRGREGHVTGWRLTYDGSRRVAEVRAHPQDWRKRPAVAWLGTGDERTEVTALRLAMTLAGVGNRPARVEAESPRQVPADIQLYRRSTNRADPKTQRLEKFALHYIGTAVMTDQRIQIGPESPHASGAGSAQVVVTRRIRTVGEKTWEPASVLWSPSLRVLGARMLASDGAVRDIQRIVAEGPKTTFQSGRGEDFIRIWGRRFDFDVPTQIATLTGRGGEDVRFRRGEPMTVDSLWKQIKIDMSTNMPTYMSGSRILWRPAQGR